MQNALLNLRYDPIYWQTACLTVNSASNSEQEEEDSKNQSTNYGKIAMAISDIRSRGVKIGLPDINKADYGFIPDVKNKQIVFGLKGMNGIGDDIAFSIIKNRPYDSFNHFLEKMFDTGLVKKSHILKLIKGGCFDSFGNRIKIMQQFLSKTADKKEKLTLANINGLLELNLIPDDIIEKIKFLNFKKYILKFPIEIKDEKGKFVLLNENSIEFFTSNFTNDSILKIHENGYPIVKESKFEKEIKEKIVELKEWLENEQTLKSYNKKLLEIEWQNNADGNISAWEMEALCFYYSFHELESVNYDKYNIKNYFDLSETPTITEMMKFKNVERPKFKLDYIVGTVLDRNKNKHTVSLLTPHGVVLVKYYDGAFAHYNQQISQAKKDGKKEILEKSWFTRGNKLVIQGYRRGNQFKPHKYKDSPSQHTTLLITEINDNGDIKIRTERKGAQ